MLFISHVDSLTLCGRSLEITAVIRKQVQQLFSNDFPLIADGQPHFRPLDARDHDDETTSGDPRLEPQDHDESTRHSTTPNHDVNSGKDNKGIEVEKYFGNGRENDKDKGPSRNMELLPERLPGEEEVETSSRSEYVGIPRRVHDFFADAFE